MSIATKAFKTAVVAPMVLAAFLGAANANAASRTVELSDLNLSQPLPSDICFVDSAKGKAITKLNTAMHARDQKYVIVADKYTPFGNIADFSTSNLKRMNPNIPNLFGEGYHIAGDVPKSQISQRYCLNTMQATYVVYNDGVKVPQGTFAKGELGKALTNGSKNLEHNFAYGALTDLGTLMTVSFNSHTQEGTVFDADGRGNHPSFYPLVDTGYFSNLTADARDAIGLPPIVVGQARQPSGPQVARN